MSVNESMTAVADEIRAKTGLSDAIGLDQMVLDIASIATDAGDVPDYVRTEAERVAAAVSALQNDSTFSFIAFSDVHVGTDSQSKASATHLAQAASIIAGRVGIDFTASLGDIVTGSASDSMETHLANHLRALRFLAPAGLDLRLVGNHDANIYNASSYMTAKQVDDRIGRYSAAAVKPTTEAERGYFYYDLTAKKLRVICLNTADLKDIPASTPQDGHHVSAAQFEWLVSALDMTGKSGWGIIVLSHHPLHWYGSMPNVLAILDAYVAGTSGSITADGSTVSYNFSGKNVAKLLGTFHGHTHNLIHGKAGTADIPRLGTPNGCFSRSNEYGSTAYGEDFRAKYGETTTYSKTANSAKDTAFCVYTVDTEAEVIHATCYGAGYDRTVSYGGSNWYTVTTNLESVSIDNSAASVEGGTVYTATLSVATNYTISSVTVTMGGVDVTASVYADGVISISEVTGNIIITAAAAGFTNQIPISIDTSGAVFNGGKGYKENTRISTSSGNESGATGMTATGFIKLDFKSSTGSHVIRVKGIDLTSGNSTFASYDSSFTFKTGWYCDKEFGAADANGVRSFTISQSVGYVRISGAFGSNPIITIDEEIIAQDAPPVAYTNQIPLSVDTDGSAYNGGKGYKDDFRINSSGVETANTGTSITGFIPITRGDVVRFSGFTWINGSSQYSNHKVVFYSPSKEPVFVGTLSAWTDSMKTSLGAKYDGVGNLIEFTLAFNSVFDASSSSVGFIRLVADKFNGDEVVTINEVIS